jgi:peptidoglycan/LPS O-acetylase OafA/YrhL
MRIEQLTFTRFIAVFAVVIFHFGTKISPFNQPAVSAIFTSAYLGVSYLYILSGFVLIIAYQKKAATGISLTPFFKSRFARVYPLYLLALIITILYYIVDNRIYSVTDLILNLLAIQAWVPGYALSLNTPGWSVSTEIFFYLLFPFLFNFIYRKVAFKKLFIAVLLLWLITQIVLNRGFHSAFYKGFPSASHDLLFYFPLMHLNEFLIGNITGLFFVSRIDQPKQKNDWLILLLFFLSAIGVNFITFLSFHNGLFALLFAPMIYLLSLNDGWINKLFIKKPLILLGEISYAIFILQKPVFLFGRSYLPKIGISDSTTMFYCIILILILCSALSYLVIENPLRKKILSL